MGHSSTDSLVMQMDLDTVLSWHQWPQRMVVRMEWSMLMAYHAWLALLYANCNCDAWLACVAVAVGAFAVDNADDVAVEIAVDADTNLIRD